MGHHRLTAVVRATMAELYTDGKSVYQVAEVTGYSKKSVQRAIKHLPFRWHQPHGVAHYEAKLDNDKVRTIRADEKSSHAELGRRYGVHWSVIRDVRARRTWKHVKGKK